MKLRQFGLALMMGILLISQGVDAQCADQCGNRCGTCDPCWDNCDFCGLFEFGANALYWKPMTCSWAYGRTELVNAARIQSVKPDYEWGLKVFGIYTRDCFYAQLSYTWLETRDTSPRMDLVFPSGFPIPTVLNGAVAKLNYDYQNVDLKMGKFLHRRPGCEFNLYGNVRWVELEEWRQLTGDSRVMNAPGPARLTYEAEFNGVGLGIGAGGRYTVCGPLQAYGQFGFMTIIGQRENPTNLAQTTTNSRRTDYESNTSIIPATEFRFGFSYEWTCRCLTTVWEIGYELDYYWNMIERTNGDTDNNTRDCIDIGFAGPYIGGRVLF